MCNVFLTVPHMKNRIKYLLLMQFRAGNYNLVAFGKTKLPSQSESY